jgi:hypothetical protein
LLRATDGKYVIGDNFKNMSIIDSSFNKISTLKMKESARSALCLNQDIYIGLRYKALLKYDIDYSTCETVNS